MLKRVSLSFDLRAVTPHTIIWRAHVADIIAIAIAISLTEATTCAAAIGIGVATALATVVADTTDIATAATLGEAAATTVVATTVVYLCCVTDLHASSCMYP